MERQFNNGDFEKLLRDNANQYRMYPSEKVWKGIHSALHTRRRWYGLSAVIMFLITGSIISIFVFNDKPEKIITQQKNVPAEAVTQNKLSAEPAGKQIVAYAPKETVNKPSNRPSVNNISETYLHNSGFGSTTTLLDEPIDDKPLNIVASNNIPTDLAKIEVKDELTENENAEFLFSLLKVDNNSTKTEAQDLTKAKISSNKNITNEGPINNDTEKKMNEAIAALASQSITLAKPKKQARVTAQIFFTPTVSYRKLTENKKVYTGTGLNYNYVPSLDVNNMVQHKPAMGLEFGLEGRYRVNQKLSLKAGFQFNINRYDIKAYSHPTEIATVAISSGYRVDSLASLSNYRNFNGNAANWLENFYFQAGLPIGAELILSDKKNFQWGVSGTIQPTYVIGDRAYVISSDYKNYAKFPDLMRRWNISTGVGTFVSYSTGRIKWQVGPHVRYQHLSSFVSELSVKEKLFSVGLRVGATLNKQ